MPGEIQGLASSPVFVTFSHSAPLVKTNLWRADPYRPPPPPVLTKPFFVSGVGCRVLESLIGPVFSEVQEVTKVQAVATEEDSSEEGGSLFFCQ